MTYQTTYRPQPSFNPSNRKFHTQMTEAEQNILLAAVHSYKNWKVTPHAIEEAYKDGVSGQEIVSALKFGKVFEAHTCVSGDVRVLVRGIVNNRSIAVVLSLCTGEVKTVFANDVEDGNRLPDFSNYQLKADFSKIRMVHPQNAQLF